MFKHRNIVLVLSTWYLVLGAAYAQEPSLLYHVSYIEGRGAEIRSLEARVSGREIFIDRLQGHFPEDLKTNPPWYLKGLPSLEEVSLLELEDSPPLKLERHFEPEKEGGKYRVTLKIESESDSKQIDFKGEGALFMAPNGEKIVAEAFVLKGEIWDEEAGKPWNIEYARAVEKP